MSWTFAPHARNRREKVADAVIPSAGMGGPYQPPRDQRWLSRGSGVVHTQAPQRSQRSYRRLQMNRVAYDMRRNSWGSAEGELVTLIRNGCVV